MLRRKEFSTVGKRTRPYQAPSCEAQLEAARHELRESCRQNATLRIDAERLKQELASAQELLRLGACVVESGVTARDLGFAIEHCDDVKRFDGDSSREPGDSRDRTITMLRALASEMEKIR